MEYWVYKETRILGPFDREAVSSLPGLDAGTLVCAGDPAGNAWTPAGELIGTARAEAGGAGDPLNDFPSSIALLDQLQIDASGLVGDDEFPGAVAEELFQDPAFKKDFQDILSARAPSDAPEVGLARAQISELTAKLEAARRRIAELELRPRDAEASSPASPFPPPAPPSLPEIPPLAPIDEPSPPPEAPPVEEPKPFSLGKPKTFKIVPALRSFKVLGVDEAAPGAALNPVPEFKPSIAASPAAPPAILAAPIPTPAPAPVAYSFSLPENPPPPTAAPFSPPPNTLKRAAPEAVSEDLAGPPAAADAAAARFVKPEPPPSTGGVKQTGRSNKAFLIVGGTLAVLLMILGTIFVRQTPKEDLKQMTTLDDGKAPIGLPPDDGAAAPSPAAQPPAPEPPAEAPAPAGLSAEHAAAIELVKEFPLDGGRGTVGRWLQYSYTADPNAGSEKWSASPTGDGTALVEYRMVPGASGGKGALYLFEVSSNGIVVGKNVEASQMLAGGAPLAAPRAEKRRVKTTAPKRAPKRRAAPAASKEIPLLPLPDSGELRPPAEDGGAFDADAADTGI
ncbi:MAG: hypothetical protein HY403_05280 [Elusimicrobia bacterium]|nr:hypothetical protein [Elusimicrobiota bacterium]